MKTLKLTIWLEPGISKAALMNVFGDCVEMASRSRFVQFSFPAVRMLTAIQLRPIHDLVKSFESSNPLKYKMFHLYDDNDNSYAPVSIHCSRGKWFTVSSATLADMNSSDSLFGLF
jgi:hypothetical protein